MCIVLIYYQKLTLSMCHVSLVVKYSFCHVDTHKNILHMHGYLKKGLTMLDIVLFGDHIFLSRFLKKNLHMHAKLEKRYRNSLKSSMRAEHYLCFNNGRI